MNYYSVVLVTEGQGRLHADFSEYAFTAGSLLFLAPYQPFMLQCEGAISGVALHFHPDFFCIHEHQKEVACHGVLFNNIYQSPILSLSQEDRGYFLPIIDQMKAEVLDPGNRESRVFRGRFVPVVGDTFRLTIRSSASSAFPNAAQISEIELYSE